MDNYKRTGLMGAAAAALAVLSAAALTGCGTQQAEEPPEYESAVFTDSTAPAWESVPNTASGVTFMYRVRTTDIGDMLEVEMSAESGGFIAVGFDPTFRMQEADIIIGYVEDGTVWVRDDFGASSTSHRADIADEGSSDIYNVTGSETGGETTISFTKPLNSGDSRDRVLTRGQSYPVIFSRGTTDNFTIQHTARGSETITVP